MAKEMKRSGGGFVTEEIKAEERNGVPVGIIEGYIASFKVEDNMFPDKFQPGAFLRSINSHKMRADRPVRFNYMHQRDPIGGFPISTVKEDDRGLIGRGEIVLADERGNSIYQRAKAGFLTDFSIGFFPTEVEFDGDLRIIKEAEIMEGSLVDEPMNADARVIDVKADDLITIEELEAMSPRELEAMITSLGRFSRKAKMALVHHLKGMARPKENPGVLSGALDVLKGMREA